jgi:hypothetical protein
MEYITGLERMLVKWGYYLQKGMQKFFQGV